jgi:hypothetical protein
MSLYPKCKFFVIPISLTARNRKETSNQGELKIHILKNKYKEWKGSNNSKNHNNQHKNINNNMFSDQPWVKLFYWFGGRLP